MDPPDSGWTLQTTSVCGIWGQILGGYNVISGGSFDNTISTRGIPHSQVWVEMDYITLDSWDETTSQWGPDIAYVQFDGSYIWYTDIDNHLSIYGQVCGWYRPNYPQGSYDLGTTYQRSKMEHLQTLPLQQAPPSVKVQPMSLLALMTSMCGFVDVLVFLFSSPVLRKRTWKKPQGMQMLIKMVSLFKKIVMIWTHLSIREQKKSGWTRQQLQQ